MSTRHREPQAKKKSKNSEKLFETGPLFHDCLNSKAKVVVHQGGTSSSKTYSILQALYFIAISEPNVITVVGESIPSLRKGAYRDAGTIFDSSPILQPYVKFWNKSERIITFRNGSIMEFTSYENPLSAKAGKRSVLFIDEANNVPYETYFQLSIRTSNKIFLAYNPTARFWVHDKLIGTPNVELFISDHRHNPYLSDDKRAEIEGIADKELWRVYARGKTGMLTSTVFPNWVRIPASEWPDIPKDRWAYGIDFGFSIDPTAVVKCVLHEGAIYFREILYRKGLFPEQIQEILMQDGCNAEIPVYCDSASPLVVAQLRRLGILALPAWKGNNSISTGILKLRNTKVFYTDDSVNMHYELGRYVFTTDKISGAELNKPIDSYNHIIDAARYVAMSHYFAQRD